jgi:hypothetical protein
LKTLAVNTVARDVNNPNNKKVIFRLSMMIGSTLDIWGRLEGSELGFEADSILVLASKFTPDLCRLRNLPVLIA